MALKYPLILNALFVGLIYLPALHAQEPGTDEIVDTISADTQLIDEEVIAIIDAFTKLITSASRFYVKVEMVYDAVQADGRKLEFGSSRETTINRPNQARFEFTSRDGRHGVMMLDGEQLSMHSPEEQTYAYTEQSGGIDETLELTGELLGIEYPLSDLFAKDVHGRLVNDVIEADYVEREFLDGIWCDHLSLRSDFVDYEIWVAEGDRPLPCRVVISYKNSPGQPQFSAQFLEWDLSPSLSEDTFSFDPPADFERVRFMVSSSPVMSEGETQ